MRYFSYCYLSPRGQKRVNLIQGGALFVAQLVLVRKLDGDGVIGSVGISVGELQMLWCRRGLDE